MSDGETSNWLLQYWPANNYCRFLAAGKFKTLSLPALSPKGAVLQRGSDQPAAAATDEHQASEAKERQSRRLRHRGRPSKARGGSRRVVAKVFTPDSVVGIRAI